MFIISQVLFSKLKKKEKKKQAPMWVSGTKAKGQSIYKWIGE